MIIVYIKPRQFFKNVDEFGNVFEIENEAIYIDNGFTRLELGEIYKDCEYQDFNEDLTFNIEKYNARNQKENANKRIVELKKLLASYDYIGTKIATGRATREEYATQIAQMTAWADEINELEASI